jgi:hypothetical protein
LGGAGGMQSGSTSIDNIFQHVYCTDKTKGGRMRIGLISIVIFSLLVSFAAFANEAADGFKQVHQGMKKVTRQVDKNAKKGFKTVHKHAKKDVHTIDKTAKKGWKQVGHDINKATK